MNALRQFAAPLLHARSGRIARRLLTALVLIAAVAGAGLAYWRPWSANDNDLAAVVLQPVKRDAFIHDVTERGELESSSNVEVACEVQSKNTAGTAIIEIVPEGTDVKAGDVLARLDSSALKEQRSQQQIVCNTSEAAVIQAENQLTTAQISKQEYLDGTFKQEEQVIRGELSVAQEDLRRAEDYARHSEKLAAKGYVTSLQLEADKFAVEKAKISVETAKTKLNVLRNYTKVKMLSQLEADIRTAEANLKAQQNTHALDKETLDFVDQQISKCVLTAPAAGQVVYANKSDRRGNSDVIIEAGASVRERQVLIRLPDPNRMQVKAKINESRVDRVQPGQPVRIRLDAFPDRDLTGIVTKVDDYPMAGSWFMSNVKEYGTVVQIDEPPPGARPGMTAEVRIRVEELPEALQIPVQAVKEHGGAHYALVPTADGLQARKIEIGSTNDKFVLVKSGLSESDQVVVNPTRFLDRVKLPELPQLSGKEMLAKRNPARKPAGLAAATTQVALASEASPASAESAAKPNEADKPPSERRKRNRGGAPGAGGMDPNQIVAMAFERSDKNGDSAITADEVSEGERDRLMAADANRDGKIERSEMLSAVQRMLSRMQQGGPGGEMANAGGGGGSKVAAPSAGTPGL